MNWAGEWEDDNGEFDFTHYPYWVLKKFREKEYDNFVMAKVKKIASSDASLQGPKNIKPLMKAALKEKFASKKDVIKTVRKIVMSAQMESYILKTSGLKTGEQFFECMKRKAKPPMIKMYNRIKNSNTVAKELSVNPSTTLDDLLKNKKLVYQAPIKNYNITSPKPDNDVNAI